jgi:hypothetical protein
MIIFTPNTVIKSTEVNSNFTELQTQFDNYNAAWTDWTPTWTNLTVGNGTLVAKYKQIGKTVFWKIKFSCGSTSVVSNNARFTPPVTYSSDWLTDDMYCGYGLALDAATANYDVRCMWYDTTAIEITTLLVNGSYSSTGGLAGPFTWGTSDRLSIMGFYEAA